MGSDGPNSSPTRTLYERLDGVQLLDPRNLNSRRSYRVRVGTRVGLELGPSDPTLKRDSFVEQETLPAKKLLMAFFTNVITHKRY